MLRESSRELNCPSQQDICIWNGEFVIRVAPHHHHLGDDIFYSHCMTWRYLLVLSYT